MPAVRTTLESSGLPIRFFSHAVQIVAEKSGFDIFAKLAGRFVSPKRNDADCIALGRLPFPVKPWPRHNKVGVVRIVLCRMSENLPWPPGIFLIQEAGYVEVRDRRSM